MLGISVPLILFLNRFLIPDISFDSVNYHMYLGFKGLNWQNNQFELYPTGIHNFSPLLDVPGYVLMKIFGYRLGSVGSLIFLYLSIFVLYKMFRLYCPKTKVLAKWWFGLMFVSMFLSFESFLQIATYYADIEVAFLMVLSIYFLLKYERTKLWKDLIISTVVVAIFVLGKMTTWYFLLPYFGYLLMILCLDKKQTLKQKIFKFVLAGIVSVSLVAPWLVQNYKVTGNPVFPFYNGIFKSEFFSSEDFTQNVFGGRNFTERLFWGIASVKNPVRLGEVHDLFTDYKINIVFVTSILILFWAVYKKNKEIIKLSGLYLALFLCWSLVFGYLRYGLVLELLGGLLLLIWFDKMKSVRKYLLIIPIVLVMMVQGKRIINMGLAYDLSFRYSFFYSRATYPKEITNFNKNIIVIDRNIIEENKPNVYLNCSVPNMTYYVMSEFKTLPVFNIDSNAYNGMVIEPEYNKVSNEKIYKYLHGDSLRFVTITTLDGLHNDYNSCVKNLKNKKYTILKEVNIDNFLGNSRQKLVVIFGELKK